MKKIFFSQTALILLVTFSISLCNPLSLFAADVTAPQQTTVPQQGEITPQAAQARADASPAPVQTSGSLTVEASPLSAPSMTENEIKAKGAEAIASIKAHGTDAAKAVQSRIDVLKQKYTGTPLENLTASLQLTLTDTNNGSVTPKSKRASDLLNVINSIAPSYDTKLAAYTELEGLRTDFEKGGVAQQIKSIQDDTQYVEDAGNTLSPLWSQANDAYADLLSAGSTFKTQAASLMSQLNTLSLKSSNVPTMQEEIRIIMIGLSDDIARVDTDAASAKTILLSATGSRGPNDVKMRTKLLTDTVTNDKNFYTGELDYYTSQLQYCISKTAQLGGLIDGGKQILSQVNTQTASLTQQIDALTADLVQFKKTQTDSALKAPLTDLETRLANLKNELTEKNAKAEALFQEILKQRNDTGIKNLINQLQDLAKPFDPKNTSASAYSSAVAAFKTELSGYHDLAAMMATAKSLAAGIQSNSSSRQVDALVNDFKSLGDVSKIPGSKDVSKEPDSLASEIKADKTKAADLLQKILTGMDPVKTKSLLAELQSISQKYAPGSRSIARREYLQRIRLLRKAILDLRIKKLTQKTTSGKK